MQTDHGAGTLEGREKCKLHGLAAAQENSLENDNIHQEDIHTQKITAWQKKAASVEDGWQVVKKKKEKRGAKEPFEMILRS